MALTWSEISTANTGGTLSPNDVAWAPFTGTPLFIIVGSRAGSANIIETSPDGNAWTVQAYVSISVLTSCAFSPTLNRAVVVGSGVAGWSDDGVTWNAATSLPEANNYTSVYWFAASNIFVAVANSGTHRVMISSDGKSWTMETAAAALSWVSVTGNGSLLVAGASASVASTQLIMTSSNGTAWSLQTHPSITVASFAGRLSYATALGVFGTAVKSSGVQKVMTSPDGTTWTLQSVPGGVTLDHLLWIPEQATWIVFCDADHYLTSTDGTTFADNTYPVSFNHNGYGFGAWSPTLLMVISPDTSAHDSAALGLWAGTLTGVSPTHGPIAGGTLLTITGTNLGSVATGDVLIGGAAALSVAPAADGLSLTCLTPAHAAGAVDVALTSGSTLSSAYTYTTITSITPKSGTFIGGTAVTITGSGFLLATGAPTFDGIVVPSYTIVSDTTITATTPQHASGAVDVTVPGVGTGIGLYTYTLPVVLLPPLPYGSPVQDPLTGKMTQPWFLWFNETKTRIQTIPGAIEISPEQIIGVLAVDQIPTLPWGKIDKTGSSIADLTTRSATDINTGILSNQIGGAGRAYPQSYGPGSFFIADGTFSIVLSRLQLLASTRAEVAGTGRIGVL